jgi:HK97 family phage prohead protease
MAEVCYKSIPAEIKADGGGFEAYAAVTETVDRANEIIARGAFKRHLPRFKRAGLVLHNHQQGEIVASLEDAFEDDHGLFIRAKFHSTPRAQELRTIMRERAERGQTSEMSIAYFVHQDAPDRKSRARRLLDVEVFEASVVNTACNPAALVAAIKGAPMSVIAQRADAHRSWGMTPGQALVASPEYLYRKSIIGLAVELKQSFLDLTSVGTAPLISPPSRPTSVLDLIRELPTSDSSISFATITLGDITAPVSSGGLKPAVLTTVTSGSAPIETIPGWCRATRQSIEDSEQLRQIIDVALAASIRRAEEVQVLNGTGTPPQLKGILPTVGVAAITATELGAAALEGATKIALAGFTPDGLVVHPTDWATFRGSATGSKGYDEMMATLWGMRVVVTPSIPVKSLLVGSFAVGDIVYRRSNTRIVVGAQGTDLILNQVTILGESRLANAVVLPTAFAKATLA